MAGGTFGGDGSVMWVIDVDHVKDGTTPTSVKKGDKGHRQEGIDDTDPGQFTVWIKLPADPTDKDPFVKALQDAAAEAASGAPKVSFKLRIEQDNHDQIEIKWNSKSVAPAN